MEYALGEENYELKLQAVIKAQTEMEYELKRQAVIKAQAEMEYALDQKSNSLEQKTNNFEIKINRLLLSKANGLLEILKSFNSDEETICFVENFRSKDYTYYFDSSGNDISSDSKGIACVRSCEAIYNMCLCLRAQQLIKD